VLNRGPRVADVERIAVLRANALGDLIVALPALEALRAAYPRAEITLLGREVHRALLLSRPSPVDRVVVLPPGFVGDEPEALGQDARDAFLGALASEPWDLALQLHGGGRNSNPIVRGLGARVTAGSRTPDAPALDRWIPYDRDQWEVGRYLEIVGLVGASPVSLEPRLPVTDADCQAALDALPELRERPYAVIHPGSTDPRRRWPLDRFAAVARSIQAAGRRPVVTGTPPEAGLVADLVRAIGGDALAADKLPLPALVGLLAGADLVVSNDTGPLHLAAAVGTRTVGIYWVGNALSAGPLTRARHRPVISWQVRCARCGRRLSSDRCPHEDSWVTEVALEDVVAAARSLLATSA
jgi:ADP-heptose:LPS heptosyltransferase